jgi:pimeloyl-ACP methyl ester carboxylesterase
MKRTIKGIKRTLQKLIISSSYFCAFQASAEVNFTEINGSLLHSQYHPNPHSSFKGTIVFQNGTGSSLEAWSANKTFFECIKQVGNLFLYDRSGLGKSSPDFSVSSANPITAELINSKLIQLLERNQIKSPYILVSHSYGGIYAGYFARKYPDSVAGMLMIDPVPSNFLYSDRIQKNLTSPSEQLEKSPAGKPTSYTAFQDKAKTTESQPMDFINRKDFTRRKSKWQSYLS